MHSLLSYLLVASKMYFPFWRFVILSQLKSRCFESYKQIILQNWRNFENDRKFKKESCQNKRDIWEVLCFYHLHVYTLFYIEFEMGKYFRNYMHNYWLNYPHLKPYRGPNTNPIGCTVVKRTLTENWDHVTWQMKF